MKRTVIFLLLGALMVLTACGTAATTEPTAEPTEVPPTQAPTPEPTEAPTQAPAQSSPTQEQTSAEPVAPGCYAESIDSLITLPKAPIAPAGNDEWGKGDLQAKVTLVEYGDFQ